MLRILRCALPFLDYFPFKYFKTISLPFFSSIARIGYVQNPVSDISHGLAQNCATRLPSHAARIIFINIIDQRNFSQRDTW